MNKKVLIVDDEMLIRDYLADFFSTSEEYSDVEVDKAQNGEEAIIKIQKNNYDLVFTDLKMPVMNGLEVLKYINKNSPGTDSVLLTAFGGGESAAKAMAYGAYEYLTKPIPIEELELLVKRIFERRELIKKNHLLQQQILENKSYSKIIGKSKAILETMDLVKLVAPTNSTVLITGESGTGKELFSEAVHNLSKRRKKPYIRINCAALPKDLIEAELFGYEKGAFTGALKRTRGKFEMADQGSILLDEISEMNIDLQAKLLRVIQEKEIYRIGAENPTKVDVRIIATSNRDLAEEVKNGTFREDLFFRLSIIPIHLPTLRERKSDIPSLINSFIKKISFDIGVPQKPIDNDAIDFLLKYNWPGNIRELQNAIERAVITTSNSTINKNSFSFIKISDEENKYYSNLKINKKSNNDEFMIDNSIIEKNNHESNIFSSEKTLYQIEKEVILNTLERTEQNKTEAARILGVTSRTLRNKLKQYYSESK